MGMRTSIKVRRNRRRIDQPKTQATNHALKTAERARREVRMMEKLRSGSLPYTLAVMSWVSARMGKKASQITEADIKTVIG